MTAPLEAPIFCVTYFDHDWETVEDLLIEDATYVEVLSAVASWVQYCHSVHCGRDNIGHPLQGVAGLIIGGPNGEA